MESKFMVVFVTVPSKEVGQRIATALLDQRLIACANLTSPVQSIYTWKGETQIDQEVLMILKTRADLIQSDLIPAIQALHPYEVPEIIALPIEIGAHKYLEWMEEVTGR